MNTHCWVLMQFPLMLREARGNESAGGMWRDVVTSQGLLELPEVARGEEEWQMASPRASKGHTAL